MPEAPNAAAELYWGLLYGLISVAMPIGYLLDLCWAALEAQLDQHTGRRMRSKFKSYIASQPR